MKCSLCNKEIVLVPSAEERAKKYGGTAEFYRKLFTVHGECQVRKNKEESIQLMKKLNARSTTNQRKML